ncbi:tyrosine protein kinase [Trypanosoma grayi]|uniref:tyrosine protein kinase n=1 Tax=Trypanosoma grayi TaxID=71804 RepID=UPI0004F46B7D|nr:tyrosine protein kinase [Trypanosoma grayi]KEG06866.1 tyrosine protein kinase [Trypanosoma grayi]
MAKLQIESRELGRLQRLHHPNILRLLDTFRKRGGGKVWLMHVLELCRGGDLKEFLVRHDPLSEQQARHIMRQLVECLCVLKQNGVMHRDLKPANILLTSSNIDEAVVKVADWGMAKSCSGNGDDALDGTNFGGLFQSTVGTVAYMSPERLSRDFYDFQAEVWAAGVIMYELLFARHPYLCPTSSVRTPEELLNTITRAEELEMTENTGDAQSNTNVTNAHCSQQQNAETRPLSHECYDLMRHMLDANATTRYTIEQVKAHPWFLLKETCNTTMDLPAVEEQTVEPTSAADMPGGSKTISAAFVSAESMTASAPVVPEVGSGSAVGGGYKQLLSAEDDVEFGLNQGQTKSWSATQRRQLFYQALREYICVLRCNAIEEEIDPGRGLILLSYAWEMFRVAMKAVLMEENPTADATAWADSMGCVTPSVWATQHGSLPDDIQMIELYIQETAQRLKRNVPASTGRRRLGATAMRFSTTSIAGTEASGESFSQPSPRSSQSTYPTAQMLIFQRAVSLIRAAASEELLLYNNNEQFSFMEEEEAPSQRGRCRVKHMYEYAMSLLRLLLQQVVVQRPAFAVPLAAAAAPATTGEVTEAVMEESGSVQVLTVPLVPLTDEADRRTVEALLYKVERFYCQFIVK